MNWEFLHPRMSWDHLGFLPIIFDESDPASARDQAQAKYAHGGGWNPSPNWSINTETFVANYPGDPPFQPLAKCKIRDETIVLYESSFVAIIQPDGSFEVSRMD